jgi:hypothetical protein
MSVHVIAPILINSAIEWVAKHHREIVPIATKAKDFMSDVLTQGGLTNTIKQIGNTIIWNRPDGASHVIGMLDQLDNSIDGLEIAQQGLLMGLSGLKSLSMVTLGFSGISAAVLAAGFVYLKRQVNQIKKDLRKIPIKIDDTIEAPLKASLDYLEAADAATGERRLHNYREAVKNARIPVHYFCGQATKSEIHEGQLPLIQFYSRKYFFALSVELASLIGLEQTDEVRTRLNAEEANLKTVASQVFKHTLAKDVEAYLAPEMRDVSTLEKVSGILEQARNLGCIPGDTKVAAADVFEANRKNIYSRGLRRMVTPSFKSVRSAAAQKLQIAHGTFEEILRLLSWREAVVYLTQNGRSPTQIASELRHFKANLATPTNSSRFVAYSVTLGDVTSSSSLSINA